MARRRIEGTKHVRRRTGIGARIAIGVAAVALLSAGGYFLIAKSGISLNLKKNKGSEIAVENSYNMEGALAGYTPDSGEGLSLTLDGISAYTVETKTSTLDSSGKHAITSGGKVDMSERTIDNGYGGSVKLITIAATAKDGYSFVGWASGDDTSIINHSNEINVVADSIHYTSDIGGDTIRIYGDKSFYAVFKADSTPLLEPLKAVGDTFSYHLYSYPALGSIYIDAGWKDNGTDCSYTNLQYSGQNWWWTNDTGNIQIDHVNFQLRYPYTQAVTMWPVDQMNHTDSDHNDSYAHNKSVKASFVLYVYKDNEYSGQKTISRYCQLGDSYNATSDAVFDIKLTDSDVLGDDAKTAHSFYIYMVPLMQQGANYQLYVNSDNSKRGRAAGTASSPVPFTTSIKAFSFEGYDFDYWRFHTIDAPDNNIYIYDESTYNANIQTQGLSFYTAFFKPATYKVYGSNLPSDGGSIEVKGYALKDKKDFKSFEEKVGNPGELDYSYTYNTDSDNSDYEKVKDKPKVHVTISPNPGYEIESWSYVLSDIGTVTGDSDAFDIVDFEEDINLTVKYTNGKARIEVESSPVTGGTATIKKSTGEQEKYDYEEFLPGKEDAILKAAPIDDDHMFLYWKDTNGQKYEDAELRLNKVASSEKFTAYFAPKTVNIKTAVYPLKDGDTDITAGTVTVTGDTVAYDETNKWYTATPNTSVTIKAQDGDGYHFQKFIDSSSNEYTTNPLIRTDIISNTTFTAVFVPDTFDINAQASPVTGGKVTVNDREGSNTVKYNDTVILKAIPTPNEAGNSDFEFRFFEDQNGNRYSGDIVKDSEGKDTNQRQFTFLAVNGAENYKAVFAPKKVNIGVEVDPVTVDASSSEYVAGNYEVTYTKDDGTVVTNTYNMLNNIDNIKGQTDVKIRAIPLNGYHFVRFVDKKGQNYTDNPLILHDVVEDDNITIVFDDDELTVNAVSSPDEGGEVTIDGKAGTQKVKYDKKVTLVAKPRTGYMFRYFQDENGNVYKGEPLDGSDIGAYQYKFNAVNATTTYKAVFVRSTVELDMKYDPESMRDPAESKPSVSDIKGGVVVTYKKWNGDSTSETEEVVIANPGRNEIKNIAGLTDITIKAVEKSGYRFSRFVDGKGNIYTDNPMVLTSVTDNQTVTAIFVPEVFEISAKASPVSGGNVSVNNREGSNTVSYGATVNLKAEPNSDYVFRYFEDEHGNRYKGEGGYGGEMNFSFKAVNGPEKYMAVFTPKEVNLTVDVDPVKLKDGKYVAGNYEVTYTKVDGTEPEDPIVYNKKAVIGGIKGQTDIKIRAIPLNGYHFVRFVDSKGNNYTDNPLILHDVVADEKITIVYDDDELTVNAVSSPDEGGTVTINGKAGTNKVKYDELVTLAAKPKAGTEYRFWYFEDEDGNHYSGTKVEDGEYAGCFVHTFNAVNPTTTYKAVFVRNTLSLEMICDPSDIYDAEHPYNPANGGVQVTYMSREGEKVVTNPSRNKINDIVGLSDVKIKAIESAGYKFSKFVDRTGKVYTDNPLVLPAVTEDLSIIAIFVEDHWMINTQASPENGGYVKIYNITKEIEGKTSLDVDYNDEIELMAFTNNGESGGEAYRFLYWKDSHGTEYLANPLKFKAINGSETYTAHFAKANVNIEVEVMPKGTGSVRFNSEPPTTHKEKYNTQGASNATLSASPESEYEFLYWKDQDGNTYTDNPLVLVDIERDLRFAAVFDSQIVGIKAVSSPASGGHIKKVINDDGSITLNAVANKGYKFANWKKGEKLLTMGTKYTVASSDIKNGDVYTAYFKIDPNYDAKSDITKEKFYREWRKVITPNYTVTRDSMKLLAMQTVAGLTQYNDATPGLKSYGAVASAEAYFDEKVAKDIARLDGVFGDAELMTVEGEMLTPDMMPDIDIYQKAAENFTDKKFGKRYDTEILTVKRILEPEGFNNKKRTYLWRYTGAEYKDNVYLLYKVDDKKPKYVTPIVDEDGVLKFTIDKLDDNDVVAVVRTKIK